MAPKDESSQKYDDTDWKDVKDKDERRRIQNKISQRKSRKCLLVRATNAVSITFQYQNSNEFLKGEKSRQAQDQKQQIASNQSLAGASYTPARLDEASRKPADGLPWGEYSFKGVDSGTSARTDSNASSSRSAGVQKASHDPGW